MKKYYIYQTTNLINGKIYIGVHKYSDSRDHYYKGSGKALKFAFKKYGRKNFRKDILFEFDNKEEAYNKEIEIVNKEFLKRDDIYNLQLGGKGGKIYRVNGFKGKHHTEENKIRNSNIHRGLKRTKETCKNISDSLKGKYFGSMHSGFIGYYITPYGRFESLILANEGIGLSRTTIRNRCRFINNNTVKPWCLFRDKDLTEKDIGKTWKEIGWGFEPVERN
jgi:hypothetical protein